MHRDWKDGNVSLSKAIGEYLKASPDVAKAFSTLAGAATASGALDPKIKELLALGISIAARCDGCIGFHTAAAIRKGATREEILDVINVAIYMGGGPSYMYGAQALEAYDQLVETS